MACVSDRMGASALAEISRECRNERGCKKEALMKELRVLDLGGMFFGVIWTWKGGTRRVCFR